MPPLRVRLDPLDSTWFTVCVFLIEGHGIDQAWSFSTWLINPLLISQIKTPLED
jgi:hypothetical protein